MIKLILLKNRFQIGTETVELAVRPRRVTGAARRASECGRRPRADTAARPRRRREEDLWRHHREVTQPWTTREAIPGCSIPTASTPFQTRTEEWRPDRLSTLQKSTGKLHYIILNILLLITSRYQSVIVDILTPIPVLTSNPNHKV